MNKIEIKVLDINDELIVKAEALSFESAQEELGKLERYVKNEEAVELEVAKSVKPEEVWEEEKDNHDCHLIGGGGESSCDHWTHKRDENLNESDEVAEDFRIKESDLTK